MASDKIINSILENANKEADEILSKANAQSIEEKNRINKECEQRLANLKKQYEEDSINIEKRAKLSAGIEERKNTLESKREIMNLAFDEARKKLKKLPDKEWAEFIIKIVLSGVDTDTTYIKVPKKDFKKYEKPFLGPKNFLDQINDALKANGYENHLKLDRDPAHFDDGIMLLGKYSDVNASFDVLLENQKELLEFNVTKILFDSEE